MNPVVVSCLALLLAVGRSGAADEAVWQHAPQSPRFRDILTGDRTIHGTHAALLWDDENLYVAYWVEEPFVHAKFKNHNDPIYYDNDVEFFTAGRDAYYEFEINGFNTYKSAPPDKDSGGWVWTRHGVWDSHVPECFARIRFTTQDVTTLPARSAVK